jgi:hypothetical protein
VSRRTPSGHVDTVKIRRPGQRTALVATGGIASTGVVVGFVGAGPPDDVVLPKGPADLWSPAMSGRIWFAVLVAVSMCVLTVTFVVLHRRAGAGRLGMRTVGTAAVMWTLPVPPAPPLLSLDAYSYVAQGTMLLTGLDPYESGPDRLGGPLLAAVAPVWRATPAPYGPLSLGMLRMIVDWSGGSVAVSVFLLRVVAIVAVAGSALLAVQLAARAHAAPSRPAEADADAAPGGREAGPARAAALALVAANPLVVLHLVGGVHLDALLMALAALTVFAAGHRIWIVAGIAAAVAFTVKATGAVLIAYVLAVRARSDGRFSRRTMGTGLLMATTVVVLSALIPNGWGWLAAMDTPGLIRHPYDPATLVGWLVHGAGALTPWTPDLTRSVAIARVVLLAGGALLVVRLLWPARRPARPGTALQVTAIVAPTVHAWYLTWGLSLAGTANRWAQQATVAVCVALCFTAMPDALSRRPAGIALTVVLLVVALATVALPAVRAGLASRVTA